MLRKALRTKELYKKYLFSKPNVQAVGVGRKNEHGDFAVVVSVDKKLDSVALQDAALIPRTLDGVKTDVIESQGIKAFNTSTQKFVDRVRPVAPGNSIGHYSITAGTLGCIVSKNGEEVILSNNHVLAASNNGSVGDPILQPGKHDGGTSNKDVIGHLLSYEKINMLAGECKVAKGVESVLNHVGGLLKSKHRFYAMQDVSNYIDAALASIDVGYTPEVRELGKPTGEVNGVALGELVHKSGRTTEYTTGKVSQVGVSVKVNYGASGYALFEDQIVITPVKCKYFSQPGDSGSAIFNMDNEIVGLLFAGSDKVTVANNWYRVKNALGIKLLV